MLIQDMFFFLLTIAVHANVSSFVTGVFGYTKDSSQIHSVKFDLFQQQKRNYNPANFLRTLANVLASFS